MTGPNGLPKADCFPARLLNCCASLSPSTLRADGEGTGTRHRTEPWVPFLGKLAQPSDTGKQTEQLGRDVLGDGVDVPVDVGPLRTLLFDVLRCWREWNDLVLKCMPHEARPLGDGHSVACLALDERLAFRTLMMGSSLRMLVSLTTVYTSRKGKPPRRCNAGTSSTDLLEHLLASGVETWLDESFHVGLRQSETRNTSKSETCKEALGVEEGERVLGAAGRPPYAAPMMLSSGA